MASQKGSLAISFLSYAAGGALIVPGKISAKKESSRPRSTSGRLVFQVDKYGQALVDRSRKNKEIAAPIPEVKPEEKRGNSEAAGEIKEESKKVYKCKKCDKGIKVKEVKVVKLVEEVKETDCKHCDGKDTKATDSKEDSEDRSQDKEKTKSSSTKKRHDQNSKTDSKTDSKIDKPEQTPKAAKSTKAPFAWTDELDKRLLELLDGKASWGTIQSTLRTSKKNCEDRLEKLREIHLNPEKSIEDEIKAEIQARKDAINKTFEANYPNPTKSPGYRFDTSKLFSGDWEGDRLDTGDLWKGSSLVLPTGVGDSNWDTQAAVKTSGVGGSLWDTQAPVVPDTGGGFSSGTPKPEAAMPAKTGWNDNNIHVKKPTGSPAAQVTNSWEAPVIRPADTNVITSNAIGGETWNWNGIKIPTPNGSQTWGNDKKSEKGSVAAATGWNTNNLNATKETSSNSGWNANNLNVAKDTSSNKGGNGAWDSYTAPQTTPMMSGAIGGDAQSQNGAAASNHNWNGTQVGKGPASPTQGRTEWTKPRQGSQNGSTTKKKGGWNEDNPLYGKNGPLAQNWNAGSRNTCSELGGSIDNNLYSPTQIRYQMDQFGNRHMIPPYNSYQRDGYYTQNPSSSQNWNQNLPFQGPQTTNGYTQGPPQPWNGALFNPVADINNQSSNGANPPGDPIVINGATYYLSPHGYGGPPPPPTSSTQTSRSGAAPWAVPQSPMWIPQPNTGGTKSSHENPSNHTGNKRDKHVQFTSSTRGGSVSSAGGGRIWGSSRSPTPLRLVFSPPHPQPSKTKGTAGKKMDWNGNRPGSWHANRESGRDGSGEYNVPGAFPGSVYPPYHYQGQPYPSYHNDHPSYHYPNTTHHDHQSHHSTNSHHSHHEDENSTHHNRCPHFTPQERDLLTHLLARYTSADKIIDIEKIATEYFDRTGQWMETRQMERELRSEGLI